MGSKIYVGGLPYSTAEQELADLFGQHGAVTSANPEDLALWKWRRMMKPRPPLRR